MSTQEEDLQEILSSREVSTGVIKKANHSFSIRSANCFQASPARQRLDISTELDPLKPPLRVFIVRHGHSLSNQDPKVLQLCSDHTIPLSKIGKKQANECAEFLLNFTEQEDERTYSLWTSPYKRARETAEEIKEVMGDRIQFSKESIFLGEQQFGLFEGLPLHELSKKYPYEYSHFEKAIAYGGRFWARMPLGESRFDVAVRLKSAIDSIYDGYQQNKYTDAIIVTHGVTSRVLTMMLLNHNPEWLEVEANPKNCAIRLLEDSADRGYIFDGFQETRIRKREETGNEESPLKKRKGNNGEAIDSEISPLLHQLESLEEQIAILKEQISNKINK